MRSSAVALSAIVALLGGSPSAVAQQSGATPFAFFAPPIAPNDMINYCVYESRIYSLGAGLCLGRTGYTCVPPSGPSTGNRAYWSSKDDQALMRPQCP
jgi:hypothetical protein